MTSLAFLSIQRVGFRKVPHVPTPTERMHAWLATRPVQFANNSLPRREARNQTDPPLFDEADYFTTHSYAELAGGF